MYSLLFSLIFSLYYSFYYKDCFALDSPAVKENRVVTIQCLSGTGSLRVGAEFLATHNKEVNNSHYLLSFFQWSLEFGKRNH